MQNLMWICLSGNVKNKSLLSLKLPVVDKITNFTVTKTVGKCPHPLQEGFGSPRRAGATCCVC